MKASVLFAPQDLRWEQRPKPVPKVNQAIVRMKAVGICGSDFHYYQTGKCGTAILTRPFILGHEAAGEVVETGPGVEKLKVGDRVAIEPGVPCEKCKYCKSGRYNLCPEVRFLADSLTDGAFVEYLSMPEDLLFVLPKNISYEQGALIEPISVGIYVVGNSHIKPGDKVAIFGQGPIGLGILKVLLAYGITDILVTDISEFRLNISRKQADGIVAVNATQEDPVEKALSFSNGEGVNCVFEASGAVSAIRQCFEVVERGGRIFLVGITNQKEINIPIPKIVDNQISVCGSFRYASTYPKTISLLSSRKLKVDDLITHRFPFEKLEEGFKLIKEGRKDVIKVVINFDNAKGGSDR